MIGMHAMKHVGRPSARGHRAWRDGHVLAASAEMNCATVRVVAAHWVVAQGVYLAAWVRRGAARVMASAMARRR